MFVLRAFQQDNMLVPAERNRFSHLPIRIGRNPLNDFSPQHPMISGYHARIEDIRGRICIRDLGSRNGIFVQAPSGGTMRVDANASVDLAPASYRFYLSPSVRVEMEIVKEDAPLSVRGSAFSGSVLGNPAMMSQPLPQSVPLPPQSADPRGRAGPTAPTQRPPAPSGAPPAGYPTPSSGPASPAAPPGWSSSPHTGAGGAAPCHPDPDEAPRSQYFDVQLDFLALQGLRELARSLIPGRPLETTGDVARLITKLHDTVDVFCRSFIPLRQGYAQFVSSLDLAAQQSINRSPAAVTLEAATTPEQVALALLDPRDRTFDAPQAVEGILADLMLHQIALLDGVLQGIRALLDELSPENIEAAVEQRGTASVFGATHRARWTEFCERFERLSDEREAFGVIFGKNFAEVYRQYWRRKSQQDQGSGGGQPRG